MEFIKYISIFLLSVVLTSAPLANQFSFDKTSQEVESCCMIDIDDIMANHHAEKQDAPLGKDCNDCDDNCNDAGCHSIVPISLNMKFPKNESYVSSVLILMDDNVVYSWNDDIILSDFSHSIWHPPKV